MEVSESEERLGNILTDTQVDHDGNRRAETVDQTTRSKDIEGSKENYLLGQDATCTFSG